MTYLRIYIFSTPADFHNYPETGAGKQGEQGD